MRGRARTQRERAGRIPALFLTGLLFLGFPATSLSAQDSDQEDPDRALPTVVVLATGGTIASTHSDEEGGLTSSLPGEQLVAAVPGLDQIALIEVQNVANVGSTDMTPALWLEVSRRAEAALARAEVAGVLVTHGTDTMEETAFFLDLTVTNPKPVILVGAMRAASEWDADGPRNLLNAAKSWPVSCKIWAGMTISTSGWQTALW